VLLKISPPAGLPFQPILVVDIPSMLSFLQRSPRPLSFKIHASSSLLTPNPPLYPVFIVKNPLRRPVRAVEPFPRPFTEAFPLHLDLSIECGLLPQDNSLSHGNDLGSSSWPSAIQFRLFLALSDGVMMRSTPLLL